MGRKVETKYMGTSTYADRLAAIDGLPSLDEMRKAVGSKNKRRSKTNNKSVGKNAGESKSAVESCPGCGNDCSVCGRRQTPRVEGVVRAYKEQHWRGVCDVGIAVDGTHVWVCLNGAAILRVKNSTGFQSLQFTPEEYRAEHIDDLED